MTFYQNFIFELVTRVRTCDYMYGDGSFSTSLVVKFLAEFRILSEGRNFKFPLLIFRILKFINNDFYFLFLQQNKSCHMKILNTHLKKEKKRTRSNWTTLLIVVCIIEEP